MSHISIGYKTICCTVSVPLQRLSRKVTKQTLAGAILGKPLAQPGPVSGERLVRQLQITVVPHADQPGGEQAFDQRLVGRHPPADPDANRVSVGGDDQAEEPRARHRPNMAHNATAVVS